LQKVEKEKNSLQNENQKLRIKTVSSKITTASSATGKKWTAMRTQMLFLAKRVMSSSQRYPFNLYLINDIEDIVGFLVFCITLIFVYRETAIKNI